jgi:MFS family permease
MMRRFRSGVHDTFRSLAIRNFRLFFGGQLISQIGNWLTLVAQVLLVLHLTNNNGVAVGVLTACQFLPVLVLGAWAGLIADRVDKRRLLIVTQAYAMLQSFALASLAFMPHPPLVAIFAVAMLGGVGNAFDNPVRRAFVVEMVPTDNVPNAVSLNSALMTSSRIFGPALAGLLIVSVGYGWCFAVDGISYLAVIACLFLMRPSELHRSTPVARAKGQVRAGLRYIRSIPDLFVPLAMMAIIGTFAFNFNVVIPLFVVKTLHGSDTVFTILFSVLSVGSLVGALVTARRSNATIRSVAIGALLFGISMLGLSLAPTLSSAFPIGLFVGFSSIVFMTASTSIVQLRAAPEMRGRVLAVQAIVFLGSTPIGGPILGVICQTLGARAGLAVGAVSCLVAAFIGWRASLRVATRATRVDLRHAAAT